MMHLYAIPVVAQIRTVTSGRIFSAALLPFASPEESPQFYYILLSAPKDAPFPLLPPFYRITRRDFSLASSSIGETPDSLSGQTYFKGRQLLVMPNAIEHSEKPAQEEVKGPR